MCGGPIVKILVAEDNPFYRRMLEATLNEWGYQVIAMADGRAAWDILQRDDPRAWRSSIG